MSFPPWLPPLILRHHHLSATVVAIVVDLRTVYVPAPVKAILVSSWRSRAPRTVSLPFRPVRLSVPLSSDLQICPSKRHRSRCRHRPFLSHWIIFFITCLPRSCYRPVVAVIVIAAAAAATAALPRGQMPSVLSHDSRIVSSFPSPSPIVLSVGGQPVIADIILLAVSFRLSTVTTTVTTTTDGREEHAWRPLSRSFNRLGCVTLVSLLTMTAFVRVGGLVRPVSTRVQIVVIVGTTAHLSASGFDWFRRPAKSTSHVTSLTASASAVATTCRLLPGREFGFVHVQPYQDT